MRFDGKNVLVTGASSGIGRATALALIDEGACVFATGRNGDRLEATRSDASDPDRMHVAVADLTEPDACDGLVSAAIGTYRRIHVLVNNAGIAYDDPFLETPKSHWDETLAVNLTAPFLLAQAVGRHMVAEGGGAMVHTASTDSFSVESPLAAYNASKAAIVMLSKSIAHELGGKGVRSNCVAPGETVTAMTDMDTSDPAFADHYLKSVPLGRFGQPEEIAKVVLFLASDDASYVTGETILADGGQLTGSWYYPQDRPTPTTPER